VRRWCIGLEWNWLECLLNLSGGVELRGQGCGGKDEGGMGKD
jgi:hypothetical protein